MTHITTIALQRGAREFFFAFRKEGVEAVMGGRGRSMHTHTRRIYGCRGAISDLRAQ